MQYPGVYKLSCGCGSSYIGETKRHVSDRVREHKGDLKHGRTNTSAVLPIIVLTLWAHTAEVLCKPTGYLQRFVHEAIQIYKHRHNLNREDGYKLSNHWKDVINQVSQGCVSPVEDIMSRAAPRPKDAIQALCRLLSSLGLGTVSPEQFRQAKYDRPESVPVFWFLLSRVLVCTTGDAAAAVVEENRNMEMTALDRKTPDDVISNVKAGLLHHGYVAPEIFQLGRAQQLGSLELLLAFSWLLHTTHFPVRLLTQGALQLDDGAMKLFPELANGDLPGEERWRLRPVDGAPLPKDGVHYALWLMGKLRLRVRALHSARQQLCTLLHRVHSTCRQPHQPGKHLSGAEAYLLRHPNRLTQVLQQLGEENARLEAFIEWRNVEPAFWQWMESVVEVKLIQLEHRGRCPSSAVPCHRGTEGVRDMALDSRLGSVSESLARIERDVRCALWPNHATWLSEERRLLQCGTAPSAVRDLAESAQQEASAVVRALQAPAQRLTATLLLLHLPFHLHLKQQKQLQRQHRGGHRQERESGAMGTPELALWEATRELGGHLTRLRASLRQQHRRWRERLEAMLDGKENIVSLPPPHSHHRIGGGGGCGTKTRKDRCCQRPTSASALQNQ
ncbi:tubulin epsilon and delta complex protein 1 isoform X3 [Petromyzon marinus]|uniref:tubulin epsilon and delta complex protein 1 isoform X3 n=2 Tax=Petromyzon marinus TaxID=7757 RepID=UPI003F6FAD29